MTSLPIGLPEISIKDKKRMLPGHVIRLTIYGDSKVIQIKIEENDQFYLVYYKNTFIYGAKLTLISEHTFIDKAFQDGIVIDSSHPILPALISNQTVSIPSPAKLFQQLQTHFTPQQTAYIIITLDSFFEKTQLKKEIEKVYLDCRRNGKFTKAYQILQIADLLAPEWKMANDRISSLEFQSSRNVYLSSDFTALFKQDPLYTQLYCFKNRMFPDARLMLEQIFSLSKHYPEMVLLWLEKMKELDKVESMDKYTKIALHFAEMKEWIEILCYENINPFCELPEAKAVIEKMIKEGNNEKAALLIWKYIDELPSSYDSILETLWTNLDSEFIASHLDKFIFNLEKQKIRQNQEKIDAQILKLIDSLLKGYDLHTVYKKLSPLAKIMPNSNAIRRLTKMNQFVEDPDHMMELGDYYAEFHQFDKAIDCYYWEMELSPEDPVPVRKLSKMYQHKGLAAEAAAYQKVFNQLKNIQESV